MARNGTRPRVGPTKYKRADTLIRRLRDRFAPGGFLHHGMGKWYPGESLPRWALGLYWRKDGEPIWRDPSLMADENAAGKLTSARCAGFHAQAGRAIGRESRRTLCRDMKTPGITCGRNGGCRSMSIHSKTNWKMRKTARAWRAFSNKAWTKSSATPCLCGANTIPMERSEWVSGAWFFRPERMYLVPGDSPMGFRLPLDSIPWVNDPNIRTSYEQDPMAERTPLADRAMRWPHVQRYVADDRRVCEPRRDSSNRRLERGAGARPAPPPDPGARFASRARAQSAPWIIRTALCTEVRDGILRVFMPPQRYLEDYLALVAAVEDTAADLGMPVLVEGYAPPHDSRVHMIKVTPDPGVIEVNLHPSASWDELVKNTTALYEEARLTRLGTEKFMLDGRHTGTGGGNHILVGGATPADSPLLRNPGLLRSLIGYWHNHPALSYLFSGIFVGPTSQAPRMDEARNDQVYEMEIAFQQIPDNGARSAVDGGPHLPQLCWSTPPAARIARNSASTSSTRRTRLRAGSACSKCARLKCRRIRR